LRSDLKRSQSDFDEAGKLYSRALEFEPRNYDGIYGLGVCHSFRQEQPRAIEYFRRALYIQPDSAPARLALGFSLTRTGQWEAAVTELRAAVALEPKMRQAYYLLGQSYQRLGRSQEAQEAFKKVEELSRQEAETAQGVLTSEDVIFSAYVLYDVPQLGKALPVLTKGWQLNAFITADSGTPFTVGADRDVSNTRNRGDRVDQVGDPFQGVTQLETVNGRYVNGVRWFNTSAFKLPAAGTYGTLGRNTLYGPGFAAVDFSIFKNFRIHERYSIQLRAEIFNLFDRLNLGGPNGSISGDGLIFGTRHGGDAPGIGYGEPRNVQFVLKFLF